MADKTIRDFQVDTAPAADDAVLIQKASNTTLRQSRADFHTLQTGEVFNTGAGINMGFRTGGVLQEHESGTGRRLYWNRR